MKLICTKAGIDARCGACRHKEPHEENNGCEETECRFKGGDVLEVFCCPENQLWRYQCASEPKPLIPKGD